MIRGQCPAGEGLPVLHSRLRGLTKGCDNDSKGCRRGAGYFATVSPSCCPSRLPLSLEHFFWHRFPARDAGLIGLRANRPVHHELSHPERCMRIETTIHPDRRTLPALVLGSSRKGLGPQTMEDPGGVDGEPVPHSESRCFESVHGTDVQGCSSNGCAVETGPAALSVTLAPAVSKASTSGGEMPGLLLWLESRRRRRACVCVCVCVCGVPPCRAWTFSPMLRIWICRSLIAG
ncbi:hypothetical protein LZ30DRAFT_442854 [Colletotrichum cereale]|nr:hypothetical protein LZ30DRAFT_442854 [Colletotrichum cereale]